MSDYEAMAAELRSELWYVMDHIMDGFRGRDLNWLEENPALKRELIQQLQCTKVEIDELLERLESSVAGRSRKSPAWQSPEPPR